MIGYRRGLTLDGSVVVVTGASSGIGRATALALAGRGARPVLLGVRDDALRQVAAECATRGAAALPLPVDITDPQALTDVARRTLERFGRLDGWVAGWSDDGPDDADVPADLPVRELTPVELRRLWDVTVVGAMNGVRAALPIMTVQHRGVLVIVSSVVGQVARPYGAACGMSAAALRSMAGALRQELRLDGVDGVAVGTVLVAAETTADRAAATVVGQLKRPRLEVVAGGAIAKALTHGHALVPGLTEWLVAELAVRKATFRAQRVRKVAFRTQPGTRRRAGG